MPKISNRFLKYFIILLLVVPSIFSCSVQKRYHRKGYTITWKKNDRVKVNHQRKNSIIERTTLNKKTVLAQRESVQMSSENREVFSNKPEYLEKETEGFKNNENKIIDSKIKTNSQLKLKSVLLSKINKITSENEFAPKTASHEITKINSDKRDFERAGRDLGLAGIFLLIGIIIAGIGVLFSIEVLAIVAFVCFCIAGLFFMLFLFEGLISLLTFGML
jgi:hypothetical protein